MRATWLSSLLIPLLTLAPACGDDSEAGPDAGMDPGTDASPPAGYPFDDPADFDHSDCDAAPGLDQVSLAGIWHLDIDYDDYGAFAAAMRFSDAGSELLAFYSGIEMRELEISADNILVRLAYIDGQERERIRAFNICAQAEDGTLSGRYATCTDGECATASFVMMRTDPLDEPEAEGLTVISEYNGPADAPWPVDSRNITVNVRHHGTTAYLARYADGLRIVDLSDPASPHDLGHIPVQYPEVGEIFNDIKVIEAGGKIYALCASDVLGILAYDVTDPANPALVSSFPAIEEEIGYVDIHTLFVEGSRAYLANTTHNVGGLDIYDIADPASPVFLGRYIDPDIATEGGFVHDLFIEDGRAYLNYWNQGMVVLDTQDPDNMTVVGTFDNWERRTSHSSWVTEVGGKKIAVHGGEDFGAHVRIVDLSTAPDYQEIGSFQTRPQVSVHNIMAVGNLGLITYYQDGFRVLDLTDPTQPKEIAHLRTWPGTQPAYGNSFFEGAIGVDYDPSTDQIYVADTHRGLFVLRLDP